jgi:hypothetical protein
MTKPIKMIVGGSIILAIAGFVTTYTSKFYRQPTAAYFQTDINFSIKTLFVLANPSHCLTTTNNGHTAYIWTSQGFNATLFATKSLGTLFTTLFFK